MPNRIVRAVVSTTVGLAAATAPFMSTPFASAGTVSPPPPGAVKTWTPCRVGTYRAHFTVVTAHRQPAITHISTYGIGPTVSHRVTRTAAYAQTVKAGWSVSASAHMSTSGFARLIAKVDVSLDGTYRNSAGHTSTGSVSVTDTVANNTRHNIQYVFYSGVTHGYGQFRYYFCNLYYRDGQSYGNPLVTYFPGKWTSYAVPGSGALSCSAGRTGLGALARLALTIGCPA